MARAATLGVIQKIPRVSDIVSTGRGKTLADLRADVESQPRKTAYEKKELMDLISELSGSGDFVELQPDEQTQQNM